MEPLRAALRTLLATNTPTAVQAIVERELNAICDEMVALPAAQKDALSNCGAFGREFEDMLMDALRQRMNRPIRFTGICHNSDECNHPTVGADKLCRIADIALEADLGDLVGVPMKAMDNSGYGTDIFIIDNVDFDLHVIEFSVIQIKAGHTSIGLSKSENNQNSSMHFINKKLRHSRDAFAKAFHTRFHGWKAVGTKWCWTTRPLLAVTWDFVASNHVSVMQAVDIYNTVLTQPMRAYLDLTFAGKAQTFGR